MNIKAAAALSAAGVLLTGTAAAAVNANVLNVSSKSPVGKASTVVPSSPEATPTEVVVVTDTETAAAEPVDSTADDQGQDESGGTGSTASPRSTHDSGDDQGEDSTDSSSSGDHKSGSGKGGDDSTEHASGDDSHSGSTATATPTHSEDHPDESEPPEDHSGSDD